MPPDFDPTTIADPQLRAAVLAILNQLATLAAENQRLRAENQLLRDEIARLKGEQGRPQLKPSAPPRSPALSSEPERRTSSPRRPRSKQTHLVVTREEVCHCDPAAVPPGALFKGYEDVLVQDLRLELAVIRFRKEKFYVPATGQTILAPLPPGYHGQFGPDVRALVLSQTFGANVSQPALLRLLRYAGLDISAGQLAHFLTADLDTFHAESSAVLEAGLASCYYQHADDTATRVNGQNAVCQVLASPCYTAFRTVGGKDRLSVLRALTDGQELGYLLNERVLEHLTAQGLAAKWRERLATWPQDEVWTAAQVEERLAGPAWAGLPAGQGKLVREGLALGAYQTQERWRPVGVLVVDDAPQWRHLSPAVGLCWVHEGRHYKKLIPGSKPLARRQERFLRRFWRYYHRLRDYQAAPNAEHASQLRRGFRRLFGTVTGYEELDAVIARTREKEAELLQVLKYPGLPLHNNAAELGARVRVRKRDVSFGPRSEAGVRAWDTGMTLVETTRKLGVSFLEYVRDRLRGAGAIRPLAELIHEQAAALKLTPA